MIRCKVALVVSQVIDPLKPWTLGEVEELIRGSSSIRLSPQSYRKINLAATLVEAWAQGERAVYGVNTGFGKLAQIRVTPEEIAQMQINYVRSHASGVGSPLSETLVRRILILRILGLGKGSSGVSRQLIDRHILYYNRKLVPLIPEKGSVGASGDLAPLAHLALTLIGEGEFIVSGKAQQASAVLKKQRLSALELGPKEALALTNGTQVSLALAMEAYQGLRNLIPWMERAAAISIEAHRGSAAVFRKDVHQLKAHRKQSEVAARLREWLSDSKHMDAHRDCELVQDAYSFRCIPQILGPTYSLFERAAELLTDELNSVSDNPLVLPKTKEILSCGHFHAQSVSMACDVLALGMASLGNLIERRVDQMINPGTTRGFPMFADQPGVQSGLMIVGTSAAAIAAENRSLAHPASIDNIPTNGNQEDHVSMAPWAARKAQLMVENLRHLIAIELLTGVRGCVHEATRFGVPFSPAVEKLLAYLAKKVPALFLGGDRYFGRDLKSLEAFLRESDPYHDAFSARNGKVL